MPGVRLTLVALALGAALQSTTPVSGADLAAIARDKRSAAEQTLDARALDVVRKVAAAVPSSTGAEALGHALLMRRHLAPAAWLYATAIERQPDRVSAIAALGTVLTVGATTGGKQPASEADLLAAIELQREAVRLLPTEYPTRHNLGTALFRLAQLRNNDRALMEEAARSLREAVRLEPLFAPLARIRLAGVLAALGDRAGASDALRPAYALNSVYPPLLVARLGPLRDVPAGSSDPRVCRVNFNCPRACPQGITGRVMVVTCEMAQGSAVLACREGKPFATSYDCRRERPKFGILVPGLDPGFSIVTPFGSIDVVAQGDGRIDTSIKINTPSLGGYQAFAEAQGSYLPESGSMTWDYDGGIQYNLFGGRREVIDLMNQYDIGMSGVGRVRPAQRRTEFNIEVGRGPLLMN